MNYKTNIKIFITKKNLIIVIATLISALIAIIIISDLRARSKNIDSVLVINGEEVSVDEYLLVMSGLRSNVFTWFSQKYDVKDNAGFWTTSHNGETPIELLKARTLERLKRIKTVQILMRTYGLTGNISFSGFQSELRLENERRKIAVEKGLPVYGPVEYNEGIYYEYLFLERSEKLKQLMTGREFVIGDEESESFYNSNKEKFRMTDIVSFERVSIPLVMENGEVSALSKSKVETVLNQLVKKIENEPDLKKLVSDRKKIGVKEIEFENLILDESTSRSYMNQYPEIFLELSQLKVNQVSRIIKEKESLSIIKIVDRKSPVYKDYKEVSGEVRTELVNEKYEVVINRLINKATVKINEKTLMNITQ